MAAEQALLSTEIVNRGVEASGPDAGSVTFSVRVRRRLPDFLQSVNLKYVKLGYHYFINHAIYLATVLVLVLAFGAEVQSVGGPRDLWSKMCDGESYDFLTVIALFGVLVFTVLIYFVSQPRPIYLIDFACYRPSDEFKVSKQDFIDLARKSGKFDEPSLEFQAKILRSSGIGDETYIPKAIMSPANCATMKEGRIEASAVMFGALDELFEKCRIQPKDIGILVVNCSLFNPTPSLSAMIVNHYKMRSNILSFNLGGMGCSAGIIALDLAKDMLEASPHSLAVVVSTEAITFTWYNGRNRSMLIPNCFFRMGGSAVLLSNRRRDFPRAKYQLEHIVRTHKGSNDRSFRCIYQEEDDQRLKGLAISRDLMEVGGNAVKTNITTLGPLVLPATEQLLFFVMLMWRAVFGGPDGSKPYIPNYKLAFEHFCVHAASKNVLDELQKNLGLSDRNMEASRMTLHRFGNTSSSSIWYEMAYIEGKERVRRGDRLWQLAFGSGFKCNSVVWRALRRVKRPTRNPWLNCLDQYPVQP